MAVRGLNKHQAATFALGADGSPCCPRPGVRIAVPPPVTAPSWTLRYLEDAPVAPAEARRDNGG